MMDQPVLIKVENLSKRFSRSLKRSLWYGLQDMAQEFMGRSTATNQLRPDEFWALNRISFQAKRGESIGLMGHNGAGKTTLLKLLNGLIKPTDGRISIAGSVRALIALGTGFNPILTGRENIYISGTILGFSNRQINARFDEIVEFSELIEFIDMPVQSYSSGMLARLGFSVAINTLPDILLVDEVLAVGDLNFAIKCYRKISEFRNKGGLIVLVSHNPYSLRTNCDRAIWLDHGEIRMAGTAADVCDGYEQFVARQSTAPAQQSITDSAIEFIDVACPASVHSGDSFEIGIKLGTSRPINHPMIAVSISNVTGQVIVANLSPVKKAELSTGKAMVRINYPALNLARGIYNLSVVLAETHLNNQLAALVNKCTFEVMAAGDQESLGMFRLTPDWEWEAGAPSHRSGAAK